MFKARVEGTVAPIGDAIAKMLEIPYQLPSIGAEIAVEMIAGNESGLLSGLDKDGVAMPETVRQRDAKLSIKYGGGEPLNPRDSSSRVIANFKVDVDVEDGKVVLTGSWPNAPFIRYHKGPSIKGNRPARNIVGIRPATMDIIKGKVRDWITIRLGR